jgi:hypothetical protein
MNYDVNRHHEIVKDIVKWAEIFYRKGLERSLPDMTKWAHEFVMAFANVVGFVAACLKHPAFYAEQERRVITTIIQGEQSSVVFRPKKTIIARCLPLEIGTNEAGVRRLPITTIYIGPGPAQASSGASVEALLARYGYNDVKVRLSDIPYRTL